MEKYDQVKHWKEIDKRNDEAIKNVLRFVESGELRECLNRHSQLNYDEVDILLTMLYKAYHKKE